MAVTNEKSTQVTDLTASPKKELDVRQLHARTRTARFDFTQGAAAGDATSTQDLCTIPAGARILGNLSFIRQSAFGAARTLDVGTRAHKNAQTGANVAEDADRFITALDVAAAGRSSFAADGTMAGDQDTLLGEATIFSTVAGGTIPVAATLQGEVVYVID